VVKTVESTLNARLDAEADELCGAKRYEHSANRVDTRAGSYERQLQTKAGEVTLKVPKLRKLPLESAVVERSKRREISVEEVLVEDILGRRFGAPGGGQHAGAVGATGVSPSTVSELNQKIAAQRHRPITGEPAQVFLDGIWLQRSWGGEVKNLSIMVAIGVNQDGHRQVLGEAWRLREASSFRFPSATRKPEETKKRKPLFAGRSRANRG
jgi:transposase-like protein